MKRIAVCVKETNDGYSSDFLYKSANFVNEGIVTDIRLSWISGVFDSSTDEFREKLKDTKPLTFVKFTQKFFYLVILKVGQTSRWNDNIAVWCQIPVGMSPSYSDWNSLISTIVGILSVKETMAKKESWLALDAILNKEYNCVDARIENLDTPKNYACRYLSVTENIYTYLQNYYQAGYQNFEAVLLLDESQKQMVTCKSSVKDLTSEPLSQMIVIPQLTNADGWQPYNGKDELLDSALVVGKNEQLSVYWKKSGCKTVCKTGVGGDAAAFQITPNDYKKLMNKSSFKIRDEKGQEISSFIVKIDGKDFRNGEMEFPIDYNMSNAKVDIALRGVEKTEGNKMVKTIAFGVGGALLGLIIGLVIGFSRTPEVVEVPVVQARPFSCTRYFEENPHVWEKSSMDSCSDLKGVYELLAAYDFKGLQEKKDVMEKYTGLKDLTAMVDKAVELGFQVDASKRFTSGSIQVKTFVNTLLTIYLETYDSWFKEELDVFDTDLFDALYAYNSKIVKQYVSAERPSLKSIWESCYMSGKSHPQHYLNAEEINKEAYMKSFTAVSTAPKTTKKQESSSRPVKDYNGQGADD